MPIIASASLTIFGDRTIRIVREALKKNGCIDAAALTEPAGDPLGSLKDILGALSGEGVQCSSDMTICCADKQKLDSFMEKMRSLRGG